MKRPSLFLMLSLAAFAAQAELVRLVPEHGVSKLFSLKTADSNREYRVSFYRPDVFRVEAAPVAWDGPETNRVATYDYADKFNDPKRAQILVDDYREDTTGVAFSDKDGRFTFSTTEIDVVFDKTDETMRVFRRGRPVLAQAKAIDFGPSNCVETLTSDSGERFYGGGQQVGRLMHKGRKLLIDCDYNWSEGGAPNPAPFVLSSRGYGILRHTFAAGEYDFTATNTCALTHEERRFDAFYFIGGDREGPNPFACVIDRYTEATGRPNMLPMWGLELGDADAYMTREKDTKHLKQEADGTYTEITPHVVKRVAEKYREADMPGGWILVNDGYGCGYTMLGSVVRDLAQYGFYTGLWTEGALDRIAWEVGTAGTRVQKLDVAWTGQGGDFKAQHALQCNKDAFDGLCNNSDARAFIWTVLGWAGTQRYGICWAGDEYGGWDLVRYMIPTITGSAMSGQAYATTDVDGIFGGSNETYLRDLQWKCWTTAMYVMNGWSHMNKSPWSYPEPYRTEIRRALKAKIRLTPYFYALMRGAWEKGTPIVRPLVWNYPDDPVAQGEQTKYEFMVGDAFLVAPVYTSMERNRGWWRKGVYLPEGDWYDFNDGRRLSGGQWLRAYPIDLSKIPVFVRANAIVPLYDAALTTTALDKTRLTFDIWPGADGQDGAFETYEDDGCSRAYQNNAYARYSVRTEQVRDEREKTDGMTDWKVTVKPVRDDAAGGYDGMPDKRVFEFALHLQTEKPPHSLLADGREIAALATTNDVKTLFRNVTQGWYYDPDEKFGTLHVKLAPRPSWYEDPGCTLEVRMTRDGAGLARVATPAYPTPTAEEDEAAAAAAVCKAVSMPPLNNTNVAKYADGDDMVVGAGDKAIIIDRLDGTYRRVTGHVATHPGNDPKARFTFTIYAKNSKKIFERANMKGSDVPQLIAVDIPADTGWLRFTFTADDETAESKAAKGVWKNVELRTE